MKFQDVIKNSVLETLHAGNLYISEIVIALLIASVLGVYIYLLYRLTSRNDFYSRDFNKTLAILPMITASILLAMQSNLLVSLGMVGALSIVRYRTAVKNPIDLAYLFFSITTGIIVGTGVYKLVILTAAFFTLMVFLLDLFPAFRSPYLLVVSYANIDAEKQIDQVVKKHCRAIRVRNRTISSHGIEMIWEVKVKQDAMLVKEISQLKDVSTINLLAHDGELRV